MADADCQRPLAVGAVHGLAHPGLCGTVVPRAVQGKTPQPEQEATPCVTLALDNGERPWTAVQDVSELLETLPGLIAYRPHLRYLLLDEGRLSPDQVEPNENLAAALIRLENSRAPQELQQIVGLLIRWLQAPEHESLGRAFTVWIKRMLLPARLLGVELPNCLI